MSTESNARRKEERAREPVHGAPRVPGRVVFASSPVVICGAPRGPHTKVAAAIGVVTCPDCIARWKAGIDRLRQRGSAALSRDLR